MTYIDPLSLVEIHRGQIPVPVFDILHKLGLGPVFKPLDDNVSGWIERRPNDTYEIVINENHHRVRQRFTAAHELGHYIYHRDLLGNGVGDTKAYRQDGVSIATNAAILQSHERQANSFAANLLMPVDAINALKRQGILSVEALATQLDVSQEAMRIRLGLPRR